LAVVVDDVEVHREIGPIGEVNQVVGVGGDVGDEVVMNVRSHRAWHTLAESDGETAQVCDDVVSDLNETTAYGRREDREVLAAV
jgi:hypothetical protein